jgi:hypothetical protein
MHDVSHAPPRGVKAAHGYTALSLLFGALVVVAPLIFTALRKNEANAMDDDLEGWGWSFIT